MTMTVTMIIDMNISMTMTMIMTKTMIRVTNCLKNSMVKNSKLKQFAQKVCEKMRKTFKN